MCRGPASRRCEDLSRVPFAADGGREDQHQPCLIEERAELVGTQACRVHGELVSSKRRPGRSPAPEGEDAYELLTERLEFEVQSVLASDDSLDLKPSLGELGPEETPGLPLWPWWLAGTVVLAAASPFVARVWLTRRAKARRRSAYEVARTDLDALLYGRRPSSDDEAAVDAFYVTLSGIVRRYLEDRFGLHSPEQTTDEFLDVLSSSPDLRRDHQDLLREFLRGADLVKFAHQLPDASGMNTSVGLAQRFLEETGEARDA